MLSSGSKLAFFCQTNLVFDLVKKLVILLIYYCTISVSINAQLINTVRGTVLSSETKLPIPNVVVAVDKTTISHRTDSNGNFNLTHIPNGNLVIEISYQGYESQYFPIHIKKGTQINLGTIFLSNYNLKLQENEGSISLTEDDLNNDRGESENTTGILQASKDIFQNKAAFDWGQAFFRIRGYGSENAIILLNGISMNKLFNGRPEWNNWGGLNDATRNQQLSFGLSASPHSFGGILGSANISTRASQYRPGLRVSSSFSNRTYIGRAMVTYNSGLERNGFAYSISASRRWGNQGFVNGTLYDALGFFGAVEYQFDDHNSLNLTLLYTPNKRGQVAAITERTFNTLGRRYNPYWGYQNGSIRNSRIRKIEEPIAQLNYFHNSKKTSLSIGASYQTGAQSRSRLDYINASNPNPNYWRYLPRISEKPQIDWQRIYDANRTTNNINNSGAARYLLYEDKTEDNLLSLNLTLNKTLTPFLTMDIGTTYKSLSSNNYGNPIDLLGAEFYEDTNQFSIINGTPSQNDLQNEPNKKLGDKIKYHYNITSSEVNSFAQLQFNFKKVDFHISGSYNLTNLQRDGFFLNQNFIENSLGKSDRLTFTDIGIKGGLTYKLSGKHLLTLNASRLSKAPPIRNSFVNIRENNVQVDGLLSQDIIASEVSYIYRSSKIKAKATGYFTEFKHGTDINFFFAQIGSGTDFFQEIVTNIHKRHFGGEFGIEYQASSSVKVIAAAAVGQHTYASNANVAVNFDTAGFSDDLINTAGFKNLGQTYIDGLKIANGPQQALTLGITYRDPKSWWLGATLNHLSNSYVDVSTVTRTNDFFVNPEDRFGLPFEDIDLELAKKLLKQEKLENTYLLNFTGGKSWRIKDTYLSLFFSINNTFDQIFRTGGYEQSRTANYGDLVEDTSNGSDRRNFGNKYWYGLGRTFFLNLAINL